MKAKTPRVGRTKKVAVEDPVERFRRAAAAYTAAATVSKETALKALVDSGIYTKSGQLAKPYR
jgi:hypothetical protein